MTLRVFEAFAGIGTQRMALRNLGIDHEVVAISEIDKFAIQSYEAIHGEVNNLGDITKLDDDAIPDHDLFTYSFPCQDISVAGQGKGLAQGSGTRSSLLWECERVIEAKRPKYLLLENVKNLVGKKNKPYFEKWLEVLENYGYTNYWQVLNAKDFGIPQNRERVFVISILGEHKPYIFPNKEKLILRLKDVLEDEVDEKFYLSEEYTKRFVKSIKSDEFPFGNEYKVVGTTKAETKRMGTNSRHWVYDTNDCMSTLDATMYKQPKQILEPLGTLASGSSEQFGVGYMHGLSKTLKANKHDISVLEGIPIKNATNKGYLIAKDGDGVDLAYPTSSTRRGRVQESMSQTLTTDDSKGVVEQYRIRKLTPLECWRLMGCSDEDFRKAESVCSNSQLYKQAGNAIVVDVLEMILGQLLLGEDELLEYREFKTMLR